MTPPWTRPPTVLPVLRPLQMLDATPVAISAEARHHTARLRAAFADQPDPGPYAGRRAVTPRPKAPGTARERFVSMQEARARLGLPNAQQRGASARVRSTRTPSAKVHHIVARAIDSGEWFSVRSLGEAYMLNATDTRQGSALVATECGDGLLEARRVEGEPFSEFRRALR